MQWKTPMKKTDPDTVPPVVKDRAWFSKNTVGGRRTRNVVAFQHLACPRTPQQTKVEERVLGSYIFNTESIVLRSIKKAIDLGPITPVIETPSVSPQHHLNPALHTPILSPSIKERTVTIHEADSKFWALYAEFALNSLLPPAHPVGVISITILGSRLRWSPYFSSEIFCLRSTS